LASVAKIGFGSFWTDLIGATLVRAVLLCFRGHSAYAVVLGSGYLQMKDMVKAGFVEYHSILLVTFDCVFFVLLDVGD